MDRFVDSPLKSIVKENKLKDKVIENLEEQLKLKDRYIDTLLKYIEGRDPKEGKKLRELIFES
jgi:hypothetical protein